MIDPHPAHDEGAANILAKGGPSAVVEKYFVPTVGLGYGVPIVRWIDPANKACAIDWGRLAEWEAAFVDAGIGWSAYFNPLGMNASELDEFRTLAPSARAIVEGTGVGQDGWVLGAVKSIGLLDATEPAIDKGSPAYAFGVPAVITDYEWELNYRNVPNTGLGKSWAAGGQVPPWEGGGCWRWWQPKANPQRDRAEYLVEARSWFQGLDESYVKVAVVPSDLAAVYNISVEEIGAPA